MERSDGGDSEIWGTWEELLLACAVDRHGTRDWDSVAKEVSCRTRFPDIVTSQTCKRRYRDLRRRFVGAEDEIDCGEVTVKIPWLEDLRRIRVEELRREVQKYDDSIVSLQTKLKRLTEERQGGRRGDDEAVGDGKTDLEESQGKGVPEEPPVSTPDNLAGALASGDRPGQSCNESNSPDAKVHTPDAHERREEDEPEVPMEAQAERVDLVTGGEEKYTGEGSCNGSSDSIAKVRHTGDELDGETKTISARPPESVESMAESKGEEAAKESSDVQSSASLSKRKRGRRRKAAISGASSGGDSPEADEVSPISCRENLNKSQPLATFLEIVRSQQYGSIFERRLEIQESAGYQNMIRQHMDLDTIRSKLEGGDLYTSTEFFRDLLLLCNNAIVFFSKDSFESFAANQLRELVKKEIATTHRKLPALSPPSQLPKPKSESDTDNSALEKRSSTASLLACRKRSSISAKGVAVSVAAAPTEVEVEKDDKPTDLEKELENVDARKIERPVARGLRTTKSRGAAMKKRSNSDNTNPKADNTITKATNAIEESTAELEKMMERKSNGGSSVAEPLVSTAKKRSVASFLDRLQKSTGASSSNNTQLMQTLKSKGHGGGGGRGLGVEQKKGGKGDGRKEQAGTRQVGGNKQSQEHSAPAKRSVGRPPKRPPPTPPSQPPAKRVREVEREVTPPPPPPSRGSGRKKGKR